MAETILRIGGRDYRVACRDGGEAELRAVAALVDGKIYDAVRSLGELGESRQLLLAALLLADELSELKARLDAPPEPPAADQPLTLALERLAMRMESLADRLEQPGTTP